MQVSFVSKLAAALSLFAAVNSSPTASIKKQNYDFRPSTVGLNAAQLINTLPIPYDFNTSNSLIANATNSWWTSSFMHGSDGHDYLMLSHLLEMSTSMALYRGSIFDITEPSFVQFSNYTIDSTLFANSHNGALNVSTGDFLFTSTLPGNATKQLRTASTVSDVQYDITFDLSAPVLFNTGIGGLFEFGTARTAEWSMPAGRTTGTLVRNGITVTIDSERSSTWYDRQFNFGSTTHLNWTWFELHLDGPQKQKVSLWVYDSKDVGRRQWATIQSESGVDTVVPVKSFKSFGKTWTSNNTNNTYAQNWNIRLLDSTDLTVGTTYGNQELYLSTAFSTYEGFVTVTGTSPSGERISGYGLVEVEPPSS